MASIYTVGQINSYIKNMMAQDFALNNIYVKGEVSNCKYHSSGHIYFTLKDKTGIISAVMFAGNRSGLKFKMEEGQTVTVLGSISVYERDGKYQLYSKQIILEGAGLLYQRFEQLKKELADMGLFDSMYKKHIPAYALKIGICTAKTGAAIQDIINISTRRNPFVQLYLYPCQVQGNGAAQDIVNGIRYLDDIGVDTIIVGRGGGSIEDLWAFNEEIVARAIFDCNTPIISAVGHETDTTIADYVADMRAPTPSAAAELAVFDYMEFKDKQVFYKQTMNRIMLHKIQLYRSRVKQLESGVMLYSPSNKLAAKKQYLDDLSTRICETFRNKLISRKHSLEIFAEKLQGLSPLNRISKGYAYVTDENKVAIASVKSVKPEDRILLTLSDGKIEAQVTDVTGGSDYDR